MSDQLNLLDVLAVAEGIGNAEIVNNLLDASYKH